MQVQAREGIGTRTIHHTRSPSSDERVRKHPVILTSNSTSQPVKMLIHGLLDAQEAAVTQKRTRIGQLVWCRNQKHNALESEVGRESGVRYAFVEFRIERNMCQMWDKGKMSTHAIRFRHTDTMQVQQFEMGDMEKQRL
jgi:hypothetical protein